MCSGETFCTIQTDLMFPYSEALQKVKEEMEGKFVGLERAVLDTR